MTEDEVAAARERAAEGVVPWARDKRQIIEGSLKTAQAKALARQEAEFLRRLARWQAGTLLMAILSAALLLALILRG
jgi:hypothetical protein